MSDEESSNNDVANCQKLPVSQYGGDPISFVDFMRDYYMYSKAYGWPDRIMVLRLPLYLKGVARDAYCQLNRETELDTWTHCKDAMAAKLVSGDVGRIMRKKFYGRTQNVGESVCEFAFELNTLAEKAFGLRENWGDHIKSILQDQFVMGVHQNIRTALSLCDFQNFDDLVKKAMRIEVNSSIPTNTTVNYTEMAKFQRPQSETSYFKEKQNFKPRTFNPPSPRNNRNLWHKNFNGQQFQSKEIVCFRCQMKGHRANQCRSNIIMESNYANKRKVIKCDNCGKLGHTTNDCYAPQSRSPSNSPQLQRSKVNLKGQQQCYSCQQYGHIARSCPNNIEKFQKPIIKKSVRINSNPQVKATFEPIDNFQGKFEAEMNEMKRKLDRFMIRDDENDKSDNFMISFDNEENIENENFCGSNEGISSLFDDVFVDKGRILYSHLVEKVENQIKCTDDIVLILEEISTIALPLDKLENLMRKCTQSISKEINYAETVRIIMSKIGAEMRKNSWLENINVTCKRNNEIVFQENVSAYATVGELLQILCEFKKWKDVKLKFSEQQLIINDDFILDYGMIPGKENVIIVLDYQEIPDKLPKSSDLVMFQSLQVALTGKNYDKIQNILNNLKYMKEKCQMKREFVQLLLPYLDTIHKKEIKQIMQKFGNEFRQEKVNFPPILIKLDMGNKGVEYFKEHWCSKVKSIRMKVYDKIDSRKVVNLKFLKQELDDDEYLIDCGFGPGQLNEVIVSETSDLLDIPKILDCECKRDNSFENDFKNAFGMENRHVAINSNNNVKMEAQSDVDNVLEHEVELCKFRTVPEISFKVEPSTNFAKLQDNNNNKGLWKIAQLMSKNSREQENHQNVNECKEILKAIIGEIYPLLGIESNNESYIKSVADQIIKLFPNIVIEFNKEEHFDVSEMMSELFRDECNKNKIITGLTFLLYRIGTQISYNGMNLESMINEGAKIMSKYMNPFVQKQGGWKSLNDVGKREYKQSGKSTIFKGISPWLILMFFVLLSMVNHTTPLIAYDCSQTELGKIYSLADVAKCSEAYPHKLKIDEGISYHIYQESGFRRATVRECIVKRTTFIFYCGRWSHSSLIEFKSIPRPVDIIPENCEAAFQTKRLKINSEIKLSAKKNFIIRESFTIKGKLEQNGDCTGESYKLGNTIVDKAMVIEEYSSELREFEGIFDDVTGKMQTHPFCDMYSSNCFTGESTLVYKVKVKDCNLVYLKTSEFSEITGKQFKSKVDFPITKHKTTRRKSIPSEKRNTPTVLVTSNKEEGMRFIRKEIVSKCGKSVYETNYKGMYVSKVKIEDAMDKIHVSEIKLTHYFNNKMDFIFNSNMETMSNLYSEIILNDCKLNREILKNRMAMVITNPNVVAPMLIAENGVFATVLGEALYSYKCKEISVKIIKHDICTNELPVNHGGTLRFMEPLTRVLLDKESKPKVLKCNRLLAPLYRLAPEVWISLPNHVPVKEPENLEMTRLEYLLNFTSLNKLASSGIYSTEDIEEARRNLLFPSKRERVITEIVDKLLPSGVGNPNYDYLLTPDHYKKATLNTMKKMWGKFLFFGQATAGFIGVYLLFILSKILIVQVLSVYRLYAIFGFSLKLIIGCVPFLARFCIISHQYNEMENIRNKMAGVKSEKNVEFQNESNDSKYQASKTVSNSNPYPPAPTDKWNEYRHITMPEIKEDDITKQVYNFNQTHMFNSLNYPMEQISGRKFYEIDKACTGKGNVEQENERRNIRGLPSNYVLITFTKLGKQPKITIQLNGRLVSAILDSGSSVTIVSEEFLNPTDLMNMIPTKEIIRSMSKDTLNIIGMIKVNLSIGEQTINQSVLVMRDSPVCCLIGMDILEQLDGVALDLKTGNLISRPSGEIIHKAHEVFLNQDITVPARHEMVYYANTINNSEEEFIFEPSDNFTTKYELPMCNGIVKVSYQSVPIRFVNFCDKPIQLKAKTRIGTISPAQEIFNNEIPPQVKRYDKPRVKSSILLNSQNVAMNKLLDQYGCIFAQHEYDLGRTHVIEHEIPLTDPTPIKQRAYRIPHDYKDEVDRQINLMLKYKILRPSFSPWSSPLVPVKKKTGELRLCVDYRKLNSVTRKDTYPLPIPQEMYDRMRKACIFSVIDLLSGYGQVGVAESCKKMTACTDGKGLYEFNVLPFGLTGAPAVFQRTMNYILMDLDHALVYIDDIIVFSTSFDEHLIDLELVFKRLKLANLKIKPSKCEWAKDSVTYVGHVISKDGLKPNPENISKVKKFPIPRTVKQVRQFLGLAGYYRRFIRNFAHIAEPLNKLLRVENKFKWCRNQQQAFDTLKEKLITEPILRHPDMSKPFILMTDASEYAIGVVLGQQDEGQKDHVIAYASRHLNKHERNYSTIEKETLAIVFGVKTYRHYLIGKKIYLYTDHSPLQWLMTHRNTASRLIRWALSLQEFDIEIRYRKGNANANADTLSRITEENTDNDNTVLAVIRQATDMDKFKKQQRNDSELQGLFDKCKLVKNNQEISRLIIEGQKYFLQEGILKYFNGNNVVTVLPNKVKEAIMMQYHDGHLGGHLSNRKTLSRIKTKYYWKTMEIDIKEWCKTCPICLTRKNTGAKIRVPLKPMPVPLAPMEMTAMDIIGPLPETVNGNKYILVFCDYLTKWPEAFALPDQKAETIAQVFVENIVFQFGTPKKLLTDRGSNFMSELFKSITELFSLLKLTTSSYHPQTDGLVERFNGTLLNMLSSYINRSQKDWDLFINPCLYAYRNCVHESTGESPFYLMYLRRNNMPIDLKFQNPISQYMETPDYKTLMEERMQIVWKQAGLNILHQQENYKNQYDRNSKEHGIKIGDLVYLNKPDPKKGLSPKLQRPFKGPYEVCGTTTTNLQLKPLKNKRAEPIVVHANRCKKATDIDLSRYPLRSRVTNSGFVSKNMLFSFVILCGLINCSCQLNNPAVTLLQNNDSIQYYSNDYFYFRHVGQFDNFTHVSLTILFIDRDMNYQSHGLSYAYVEMIQVYAAEILLFTIINNKNISIKNDDFEYSNVELFHFDDKAMQVY